MKLYPNLLPYEIRFDRCPCNGFNFKMDSQRYIPLLVVTADRKYIISYGRCGTGQEDSNYSYVIQFPYLYSEYKRDITNSMCIKCGKVPYRLITWEDYQLEKGGL